MAFKVFTTASGVYGDVTGGVARNGAFDAQRVPAEKFFSGTATTLAASDPTSKLFFMRPASVSTVPSGSGTFADGTTVNWGIYGSGHTIKDQYTPGLGRKPDYMQVMRALATPDAVVNTLKATYSNIVTSTPIISTSDGVGGSVTGASISIDSGNLTNYSVTASSSGTWTGRCSSCGTLLAFKTTGVTLNGTGPVSGTASGKAFGQVVGPTGAGAISSFKLQDGSIAITGSFAVQ